MSTFDAPTEHESSAIPQEIVKLLNELQSAIARWNKEAYTDPRKRCLTLDIKVIPLHTEDR